MWNTERPYTYAGIWEARAFIQAIRKAGGCLSSLKKSLRQVPSPYLVVHLQPLQPPILPSLVSTPYLSWAHPMLVPHHPLHSICTGTCSDEFKNPFLLRLLIFCPSFLKISYPSPPFSHRACLHPAKNSSSLSRKLL